MSSSLVPHFCTTNCKSPIRAEQPNIIHPYLPEIDARRDALREYSIARDNHICSISISSDRQPNRTTETSEYPLPLRTTASDPNTPASEPTRGVSRFQTGGVS